MSGRLLIVATPIGNLGDLSPRAAEALRTAAVVLAEDTRRTRPLLEHVGSHAKLVSCHQHNEEQRVPLVLERLGAGEDVALVTDAGAPGVSDPGGRLVAAVVEQGGAVEVLPGPSALVGALMGAGLVAHRFAFLGFLPRRTGARREILRQVSPALALVLFEAPGRVEETLAFLAAELGPRRVVVARELTKKFETFHRGVLGGPLEPPLVDKGEVVLVVEAGEASEDAAPEDAATLVERAKADTSLTPKQRAKQLAKALGISPREAYARLLAEGEGTASQAAAPAAESLAEEDGGSRMERVLRATESARGRLSRLLADAARALVEADEAAARVLGAPSRPPDESEGARALVESGIEGADELMRWLESDPRLPAPVEAREAAKALLSAMSAADALEDALHFLRDDEAARAGRD